MGKIAKLNYLIEKTYHRIGSPETRKRRILGLKRIAKDLTKRCSFKVGWYGIQKTHVDQLIYDWQKKGYAYATIKNRLALLRHFVNLAHLEIEIPNNPKALMIRENKLKQFSNIQKIEELLDEESYTTPRFILGFEYYFGLTKKEAMKIRYDFHYEKEALTIPNHIATNRRRRQIPIVTELQRKFISIWERDMPQTRNLLGISPYESLSFFYQAKLRKYELPSNLSYRRYYAWNRYHDLFNQQISRREVLKSIQQEMGLSLAQIRRYLRELNHEQCTKKC